MKMILSPRLQVSRSWPSHQPHIFSGNKKRTAPTEGVICSLLSARAYAEREVFDDAIKIPFLTFPKQSQSEF